MSNVTFPVMPGLTWDVGRIPAFNTLVHRAASGREARTALQQFPLWNFKLKYEVLRNAVAYGELKTLAGFFISRLGSWDSFLYIDPDDSSVVDQTIGTGDGVLTQFQLIRDWGGFLEPVMNVNGAIIIKVNGTTKTLTTDYLVDSNGMVTFTVAPAASASITWSGSFYYRVRFLQDTAEFNQFMKDLWELKTLEFVGSVGNKV